MSLGDTRHVALVQPSMLLCAYKDSPDAGAGVKCQIVHLYFFSFLFFPVLFVFLWDCSVALNDFCQVEVPGES